MPAKMQIPALRSHLGGVRGEVRVRDSSLVPGVWLAQPDGIPKS